METYLYLQGAVHNIGITNSSGLHSSNWGCSWYIISVQALTTPTKRFHALRIVVRRFSESLKKFQNSVESVVTNFFPEMLRFLEVIQMKVTKLFADSVSVVDAQWSI